jgi:hypothetical protein
MAMNRCQDFVPNRDHGFETAACNGTSGLTADERAFGVGAALGDGERRAPIGLLKTL